MFCIKHYYTPDASKCLLKRFETIRLSYSTIPSSDFLAIKEFTCCQFQSKILPKQEMVLDLFLIHFRCKNSCFSHHSVDSFPIDSPAIYQIQQLHQIQIKNSRETTCMGLLMISCQEADVITCVSHFLFLERLKYFKIYPIRTILKILAFVSFFQLLAHTSLYVFYLIGVLYLPPTELKKAINVEADTTFALLHAYYDMTVFILHRWLPCGCSVAPYRNGWSLFIPWKMKFNLFHHSHLLNTQINSWHLHSRKRLTLQSSLESPKMPYHQSWI